MTVAELAEFRSLHDALPLSDPDRHDLDDPQMEDRFAHLAADHPDRITYDHDWTPGGTR